ncbi:MAG: stage 0 sporulation family protein [Oscillospiraceae bacterium]|nr:stage 0 sporulation family protein [Oscillospiraceae bacterium]
MVNIAGIRFRKAGKIYYFDPEGVDLAGAKNAVVETARGVEFGEVVVPSKLVEEDEVVQPLRKVIRVATEEDEAVAAGIAVKEAEAFRICVEKIKERKLEMKLVDVEYTFDHGKILFYFTHDGRVDFRELARDLAHVFKTRIELRQIAPRDEAKKVGGMGVCGRVICCKEYLEEFQPISIKMAKEQGKSLNPSKISGLCGRLMCCLKYEQEAYEELLRKVPPTGSVVETARGRGVVAETSLLNETVKVRLDSPSSQGSDGYDGSDLAIFKADDVKVVKKAQTSGGGGDGAAEGLEDLEG